jgi:hypothetical protein
MDGRQVDLREKIKYELISVLGAEECIVHREIVNKRQK